MRIPLLSLLFVVFASTVALSQPPFDDPMFRRCVSWMLDGQRGAGIDRICLDEYDIPSPSLFLCAQKVETGFLSPTDREACAIVYEEQVKKVRAGFVK